MIAENKNNYNKKMNLRKIEKEQKKLKKSVDKGMMVW